VKFIFATTEVEKVPATIVSRCQRFDFRNIPTREIAGHLKAVCQAEKVQADEAALFRISRAAAGSMRDGLSLLDQLLAAGPSVTDADVVRVLGTPPDERMLAMATAVADGAPAAALGELSAVLESGVSLSTAAAALGDVFRNLMIASVCGSDSDLIEMPEQQRKVIGELSKQFSTPALVHAVGICQSVLHAIKGSSVARALVEAALVRLADAEKFVDPGSLIERLESIATGRGVAGEKKKPIGLPASAAARPAASGGGTYAPRAPAGAAAAPGAAVPAQAAEAVDKPASEDRNQPPAQPAVNSAPNLSTAEVNELAKDPAVKAVLEAFGGSIVHYEVGQPMLFAAPPETQSAPAQTPTPHQEPLHEEEDEE
jgi:DNA polymerase-3 subunit gamma/tau